MHQFQRFHDNVRWNIALFIALLTDERSDSTNANPARDFAIAYLAAVLEHHNDPANFDKREEFVKLWKHSKYDFFTFTASQKITMKRETKRLKKEWAAELSRVRYGMVFGKNYDYVRESYNAKVAKVVGVLVPGQTSLRLPDFSPPDMAIKDLQAQSGISARAMQKDALLKALNARAEDYSPSATPVANPEQQQVPPEDGNNYAFVQAEPNANATEGQQPGPLSTSSDYPALHFPKVSRFEVNKDAVTIVDKKVAISVLKKTKPKEILAKLMELFPEDVPYAEYLNEPEKVPVAVPEPIMTWEQNLEAWKASSAQRHAAAVKDLPIVPGPAVEPSSAPSEPPQLEQYMMEVDDYVLQTETQWAISADAPVKAGGSLFGGGGSLFGGGE